MSTRSGISTTHLRYAPLAVGLAAALGLSFSTARAGDAPQASARLAQDRPDTAYTHPPFISGGATKTRPNQPTASHDVTNCGNDGPGSLRQVIADPATNSGDTINLSPLKLVCSKITLDSQIDVHQASLIVEGSGSKYLTIDGNHHSRVFNHSGAGTLLIGDVTVANGYYSSTASAKGGCIYSDANVALAGAVVTKCSAKGLGIASARGGGIFALGTLSLLNASITDNDVAATDQQSNISGGGAVVLDSFQALYSSITGNASSGNSFAHGGGITTYRAVTIQDSTISANKATLFGGGLNLAVGNVAASVTNSTISGNSAKVGAGIVTDGPLTLANSTVAFNTSSNSWVAGLYSHGAPLTLQSSIIADNSNAAGPSDLDGSAGATITGASANNLITSSTLMTPMDTLTDCPKLDALANNGGSTLTHGLKPNSPAISKGAAAPSLTIDQRLAPRITGMQADIGAVEWKQGDKLERILAGGFDGLCDQ